MKGLVFKDLLLMKKMNKKVILVMYFFVIAISFFGENEVYSIMSSAFFSLFIGMHLMMTMTYDGLTSWKQYELTLPLSKYQIIFSKYLTSLLLVPISIMGTVIIYIIRYVVYHNFTLSQFGFSIAIAIALPVLWCFMVFYMFSNSTVVWLYECSVCENDLHTSRYLFRK